MLLLEAHPTERGILAATLAVAAAAIVALTSGYPESGGWLLSEAPAAVIGAKTAAASAPPPAPDPVRTRRAEPIPAATSTLGAPRGAVLYLLIEAGRPAPLFAR